VFAELLGHTGPADGADVYTFERVALVRVDGKYAYDARGRLGPWESAVLVAVVRPRASCFLLPDQFPACPLRRRRDARIV
jgi:hypothetical protein